MICQICIFNPITLLSFSEKTISFYTKTEELRFGSSASGAGASLWQVLHIMAG
jgi:hypothetical protein